ncbi:FkbM family methyltransferase [Halorientalis pallida]|nr:FkbM family methyltransferase [Halorientalis pallida]
MSSKLIKHMPKSALSFVRGTAARYLPEGGPKDWLRQKYTVSERTAKVEQLDIVDSGFGTIEGETYPYIELANGHVFYGYTSDEYENDYAQLDQAIKDVLIPEAYFVAYDYYRSYVDTSIFDQIKYYDPKPGDTVVQVGPYHGHFTTKLSHMVGEEGTVVAIEAHPENHRLLEANVRENCLDNVRTLNRAVSNTDGDLEFYVTTGASGKTYSLKRENFDEFDEITEDMISTITVEGLTLDGIVDDMEIESVDYLILTVNMEEANILRGAFRTLQKDLDLALVACSELSAIEEILAEHGFEYTIDEAFAPVVYASKRGLVDPD